MLITTVLRVAATPALVSTSWLAQRLAGSSRLGISVLDATWDAGGEVGYADYSENHIAGALFLDLNQIMKVTSPTILRSVPSQRHFGDYVASLGVNNDSHVVLYDTHLKYHMPYGAARAWWLFKLFGHEEVSVLDGGIRKWMMEGRPTTANTPTVQIGDFRAKLNKDKLFTFDEMIENVKTRDRQVLDCRSPENFKGRQPEPCSGICKSLECAGIDPASVIMRRGHVRHAVNLSGEKLDDCAASGLQRDQLLQLFKENQIDLSRPLVTMCYTGMVASSMALAAAACGHTDVAVYAGSWTEFAQRADEKFCEHEPDEETT